MRIRKSKGVTKINLTQLELRQLAGAQEIIDTMLALGGTMDDVTEAIANGGEVEIGKRGFEEVDAGGNVSILKADPDDDQQLVGVKPELPAKRKASK